MACRCRSFFTLVVPMHIMLQTVVNAKTMIIEPATKPVYLKSGTELNLLCEQTNNYKVRWLRMSRLKQDSVEYVLISADDGFYQTFSESNGHQFSNLTKAAVDVNDSGSYKCEVQSGLDASFSVEVNIIQVHNIDGLLMKQGNTTHLLCLVSSKPRVIPNNISWMRNDKVVYDDGHKYKIHSSSISSGFESNLTVFKSGEQDVGEYTCVVTLGNDLTFRHIVYLMSSPHIKQFEKSKTLVEGHDLVLECRVWGWPMPNITWYRNNQSLMASSSDHRVSFQNASNITNSLLVITNLTYQDRTVYACEATAIINSTLVLTNRATIFVRIKDKLAPLYPLLGILIEVAILAAIIVVYEQRRRKRNEKLTENSTNDVPNSFCHKLKDDEVRLRK